LGCIEKRRGKQSETGRDVNCDAEKERKPASGERREKEHLRGKLCKGAKEFPADSHEGRAR